MEGFQSLTCRAPIVHHRLQLTSHTTGVRGGGVRGGGGGGGDVGIVNALELGRDHGVELGGQARREVPAQPKRDQFWLHATKEMARREARHGHLFGCAQARASTAGRSGSALWLRCPSPAVVPDDP